MGGQIKRPARPMSGSVKAVREIAQVKLRQRALLLQGLQCIIEGADKGSVFLRNGNAEPGAQILGCQIGAGCEGAACMALGTVKLHGQRHAIVKDCADLAAPEIGEHARFIRVGFCDRLGKIAFQQLFMGGTCNDADVLALRGRHRIIVKSAGIGRRKTRRQPHIGP